MSVPIQIAEIARIAEQANYDHGTGLFTRALTKRGWPAGKPMGGRDANGYVILRIDGIVIKAHRLAWFKVHGTMPCGVIDHINGDKADNRIANLRDVPKRVNALNSWRPRSDNLRTGLQGVQKLGGRSKQWAARISLNGKRVHLGCFNSPEDAHAHYIAVKRQLLQEAIDAC